MTGASGAGAAVSQALCAVLERIDAGGSVSTAWLQRRWPECWEEIRDAVSLDAGLGAAEPASDLVGPYRLEAWLGRGGMGTVYRARRADDPASPPVAVKILHPQVAARPGFVERFRREAEIGLTVRDVHVVRTMAHGETARGGARTPYLVMEHVEGRTLRDLVEDVGPLPEPLCLHVAATVARGLAAIHAAGAVHRDVKPENVLVTPEEFVKVMDLGVAAMPERPDFAEEAGAFVGTPRYAAPEQIDGSGAVDGRTDLYALGLVLHEMATGAHPRADRPAGLRFAPPSARRPELTAFFDAVVLRLLAPEADGRFASAQELLAALETGRARPDPGRLWEGTSLRRPRLVGRDAELARLFESLRRAQRGEGGATLVVADAGLGKSRVVEELLVRARADGVRVLRGAFHPTRGDGEADGFSGAYGRHLAEHGDPPGAAAAAGLRRLLRASRAAGDVPEPADRDALTFLFAETTRELARDAACLILVEDLHFADEPDLALFRALAAAARGVRALLVGTSRGRLVGVEEADVLALGPLAPEALELLVADALGSRRVLGRVVSALAPRADGSPYFALEMLRTLEASGALRRGVDGEWRVARPLEGEAAPATVQDAVLARCRDLPDDDLRLLRAAACAGHEFDSGDVARALRRDETATRDAFASLARRTALVRGEGPAFAFEHHLARDSVVGATPPDERAALHRRLAEAALERAAARSDGRLDDDEQVAVARHFLDAGLAERAGPHVLAALGRLTAVQAHVEAAELAERALAAPGVLVGAARADAALVLADCLELLGRTDAVDRALAEAAAATEESDALRTLRRRVRVARRLHAAGRPADALEALGAAASAAPAGDRAAFLRARAEILVVMRRFDDAVRAYREAAAEAASAGDEAAAADTNAQLGRLLCHMERYADAEPEIAKAEDAGARLRLPRVLALAALARGRFLANELRMNAAAERFLHARSFATSAGHLQLLGDAELHLGVALEWACRGAEAVAAHRRAGALLRELRHERMALMTDIYAATALLHMERLAETIEEARRILAAGETLGDARTVMTGRRLLASAYALIGDRAEASAHLEALRVAVGGSTNGHDLASLGETEAFVADLDDDAAALRARTRFRESAVLSGNAVWRGDSAAKLAAWHAARDDAAGAAPWLDLAFAEAGPEGLPSVLVPALAASMLVRRTPPEDLAATRPEHYARARPRDRLFVEHVLWKITGVPEHLERARRLIVEGRRLCPPQGQSGYATGLPLRRLVVEALRRRAGADVDPGL